MDKETRSASRALADQMRRIIARLAVVRPPAEELRAAAEAASAFADRLDTLPERPQSWQISEAGLQPRDFIAWSPVSGTSNPMAPPLRMWVEPDDEHEYRVLGEVTFGDAYEGPPRHVHGGMVAAMFDELLGFAQLGPGFTAYLKVDYRKPTPLNRTLELASWIDSIDGRKRIIRGTASLDGAVLAEAEGLFIAPRGDLEYLKHLGVDG